MATRREQLEARRWRIAQNLPSLMRSIRGGSFDEFCDCGHTRGAHQGILGINECMECSCVQFNAASLSAMEPDRVVDVVPVRDDVTSFPVTGYVMRDDAEWAVVIQRVAVRSESGTKLALDWPRRWAWNIRCAMGPVEAKNRYLNARGMWEMSDVMPSEMGTVLYETPEEAYEIWQRYVATERAAVGGDKARNPMDDLCVCGHRFGSHYGVGQCGMCASCTKYAYSGVTPDDTRKG